jgi:hypothetical protein
MALWCRHKPYGRHSYAVRFGHRYSVVREASNESKSSVFRPIVAETSDLTCLKSVDRLSLFPAQLGSLALTIQNESCVNPIEVGIEACLTRLPWQLDP